MRTRSRRSAAPVNVAQAAIPALARPETEVAYLIKQLQHSSRQAFDEALRRERLGLSLAHLVTLYVLETDPGAAGAELARQASVTAQTMHAILRRLEQDKLIERRPHPTSARSDSWFVTRAGQLRLRRAKGVGERVCRRLLLPLSDAEVQQFQSFLLRCIASMDMTIDAVSEPAEAQRRRARSRKA